MRVTPAAYGHLVSSLSGLAGGRLVVMLEGGYCLDSLSEAAALSLKTLLGDSVPSLPKTTSVHPSVLKSILGATAALRPFWKCMQLRAVAEKSDILKLESFYPRLCFNPPKDFPPEKYPTRDYYLVFDEETNNKLKLEIAHINLSTRLRETENKVCVFYDEEMCQHKDDCPHPETPERIQRIYAKLKVGRSLLHNYVIKSDGNNECFIQDSGFLDNDDVTELVKGRKLTEEEVILVHSQEHW